MTGKPPTRKELQEKIRQRQEEATRERETGQGEEVIPFISAWPKLKPEAMGPQWVREFIHASTEHSEADPAAVLFTFLTRFAAEAGRSAFLRVGDATHRAILFSGIVGATAKARKGTSAAPIMRLGKLHKISINGYALARTSPGPLSSGEGLIYNVRDESSRWDEKNHTEIVSDPGVEDKRLFVLSEELAGAFKVMQREGNTLSPTLRCFWDGASVSPLTKNNRISATDPHVCICGHVTHEELMTVLSGVEHYSGLSNRFLWVCAKRGPLQPIPIGIHENDLIKMQGLFIQCAKFAQNAGEVHRTKMAEKMWVDVYPELTRDRCGLIGAICGRAEAQVLRLSLVFALLCQAREIDAAHIEYALAAWDYSDKSAEWIFNVAVEEPIQGKIMALLKNKKEVSLTEIRDAFGRNMPAEKIHGAIKKMESLGAIRLTEKRGVGRPKQIITLNDKYDKTTKMR